MDSFIEAQRAAGGEAEPGKFTLNPSKAREKLRQFQLADPSFYILKLVQAATASRAGSIDVKLGRFTVELSFLPQEPGELLDLTRVFAVLDDWSQADDALRHLVVGLNACLAVEPKTVIWSIETPQGSQSLVLYGNTLEMGPKTAPREVTKCTFILEKPSGFGAFVRTLFSRSAEHRAIYSRCRFAPRLRVDARAPQAGWSRSAKDYEEGWIKYMTRPFVLLERYLTGPGPPLNIGSDLTRGFEFKGATWYSTQARYIRSKNGLSSAPFLPYAWSEMPTYSREFHNENGDAMPEHAEFSMGLRWMVNLSGPTRIDFVKDGVALDTVTESLGLPGLECVCAVEGLEVDLSEFGVVRNAVYEKVLEKIKAEGLSMAARIRTYDEIPLAGGNETNQSVYLEDVRKGIRSRLPKAVDQPTTGGP